MVKDELGNATPLVDRHGQFVQEVTDFAGRYVKDYGQVEERPVDVDIVIKLKEENKLFRLRKIRALLPALLAYRSPGVVLPAGQLVHQGFGQEGAHVRAEPNHQLETRFNG